MAVMPPTLFTEKKLLEDIKEAFDFLREVIFNAEIQRKA